MDARPNVINKILPCTKRKKFNFVSTTGSNVDANGVIGCGLDDTANEYVSLVYFIPKDFKSGSDIKVIIKCCGIVNNPVGADKYVRLTVKYNFGCAGTTIGILLTGDDIMVTIADGELKWSLQEVVTITIPDLQIDDTIGVVLTRYASHAEDNYVGDFMICRPVIAEYTANKIGVT